MSTKTYIKVRCEWMYLYRAIDSVGDTVEFWFSEHRDLLAAKRFFRKALERHGRPDRIVIDGSQTNHEAITSCDAANRLQDRSRRWLKPITVRKSRYWNNRIEQDHRRIKRRVRRCLSMTVESGPRIFAQKGPRFWGGEGHADERPIRRSWSGLHSLIGRG